MKPNKPRFSPQTGAQRVALVLLAALCGFAIVACLRLYQPESYMYTGVAVLACAILLFFITKAAVWLAGFKNERWIPVIISLFTFVVYAAWTVFAKMSPQDEYAILYAGAMDILEGGFDTRAAAPSDYFHMYNLQIPYAAFMALCMKIFGTSYYTLQMVECGIQAAGVFVFYSCARQMSDTRGACVASAYYGLLAFNILGASIVNNQHVALLLGLLGVRLFMTRRVYGYVGAGVLLSLGTMARNSTVVFFIAMIVCAVPSLLHAAPKRKWEALWRIVCLAAAFWLCMFALSAALVGARIAADSPVRARLPYAKYVQGLTGGSLYGHTGINAEKTPLYYDLQSVGFDYNTYNEACKAALLKWLGQPAALFAHIGDKMTLFVGGMDNQAQYAAASEMVVGVFKHIGHLQYVLLLIFAAGLLFRKDQPDFLAIFVVACIGFFLMHVFVEAQTRYRYEMYAALTLCAGVSADGLLARLKRKETRP